MAAPILDPYIAAMQITDTSFAKGTRRCTSWNVSRKQQLLHAKSMCSTKCIESVSFCVQGHLCCFYADNYYQLCQRHEGVPRLTSVQVAAFAEFNRLAASDELRMDYKLQPGDIQLLHNHSIVHCRSGFEDYAVILSSACLSGRLVVESCMYQALSRPA